LAYVHKQGVNRHIYILSGLGADERAFARMDWGELEVHHISWLPVKRGDDFQVYVKQLAAFITEPHFILLGMSFGGMIAQEIAKLKKPDQLILISSFKGHWELPWRYRFIMMMRIDAMLRPSMFKQTSGVAQWFFGTKQKRNDGKLLKRIIDDTNEDFIAWALHPIVVWRGNKEIPTISIHGSNDRLIPIAKVQADYIIQHGGHFMVYNHADEISAIVQDVCRESAT